MTERTGAFIVEYEPGAEDAVTRRLNDMVGVTVADSLPYRYLVVRGERATTDRLAAVDGVASVEPETVGYQMRD